MVGTQILNLMVRAQLQLSASMADNPTAAYMAQSQHPTLSLFQNLKILRTIASGHDVIHTPVYFLSAILL